MSDWIPHDGGKCPVAPWTQVEVRRKMDDQYFEGGVAEFFTWEHQGSDWDILSYRQIDDTPAPVDREFRRAVFLAVFPLIRQTYLENGCTLEQATEAAWDAADEAIAQEGA